MRLPERNRAASTFRAFSRHFPARRSVNPRPSTFHDAGAIPSDGSPPAARGSLTAGRPPGYTLLEVVVALAIFGIFLVITAQLTREMSGYEKKLPVNFLSHPQVVAVISRLRKDVLDTTAPYYPAGYENYVQGDTTLILYTLRPTGYAETVVWDFSEPGKAIRRSYNVGVMSSEWIARGLPAQFLVEDFPIEGHPDSVRIVAHDSHGLIGIDQIFQPRPHG